MADFEEIDPDAFHTEEVMLRLRLRGGLAVDGLTVVERVRAESVVADGLVVHHGDRLVLTDRGRLLADAVVRTLLCSPVEAALNGLGVSLCSLAVRTRTKGRKR